MKKYLALVVGIVLVLGLAVTAFAEDKPEITLGGKILVRGWYFDNVSKVDGKDVIPGKFDSTAFYSTNVNLMVDAKVSDSLRGMIEFETASTGSKNSGLFVWGDKGAGYDTKPYADILIRQAWIQYVGTGLMGVPAGLKIGHMPISLGEKIFLNNERFGDDAILLWIDPMKEAHIAVGTVKLNEGRVTNHTDDVDGYVALATYQWDKDNMVGINYLWAHSDGYCPSADELDDDGLPTFDANVGELNFHNVGIHAKGMIAGFNYAAEADMQFGKIEDYGLAGEGDVKPRGWAVYAKVGYMLDPVNIRASFAYGSGDNDLEDDKCKEFQTLQGNDYGATARLVHYTQIYERTVRTAALLAALNTSPGHSNTTNTGIANTTYYNLGMDLTPMKDLSLSIDGFLLRASKTGAWEQLVESKVDKDLGWEIDAKASYKITKNLSYFVEAGYFDTGDFYKDIGADDKGVTQLVHGLLFTF